VAPTLPRTYAKVMLDPGHGGKDPGAVAPTGMFEKTVNLQVAHKVAYLLRQWGVTVAMTRTNDVFVELDERVSMANRFNPDLFVSIHADACDDPAVTGYSVYVARVASSESKAAAGKIVSSMASTGFVNRGVKQANYKVLVGTRNPAILVEMGYMSNRYQATLLSQNETQERIAYSIARGIYDAVK
jgi:N-acetylmuramoyl-L-alanine amidase